jgi:hypothetical protein
MACKGWWKWTPNRINRVSNWKIYLNECEGNQSSPFPVSVHTSENYPQTCAWYLRECFSILTNTPLNLPNGPNNHSCPRTVPCYLKWSSMGHLAIIYKDSLSQRAPWTLPWFPGRNLSNWMEWAYIQAGTVIFKWKALWHMYSGSLIISLVSFLNRFHILCRSLPSLFYMGKADPVSSSG